MLKQKTARQLALIAGLVLALGTTTLTLAEEAGKPAAKTYSLESTIGDLLANPQTKAVVEKYLPGLSGSPQLTMVQSMSVQQLAAFPQANIDDAKLKSLGKELAAIVAK